MIEDLDETTVERPRRGHVILRSAAQAAISLVPPARRTTTLVVSDASGRAPRDIKTLVPARLMAAWTLDGREIVHAEGLGTAAAVHLLAPDGSNDRLLATVGGAPDSQIDWIDLAVLGF